MVSATLFATNDCDDATSAQRTPTPCLADARSLAARATRARAARSQVDFMEREHVDATLELRRRLAEAEVREAELSRLAGQRIAVIAANEARRRISLASDPSS